MVLTQTKLATREVILDAAERLLGQFGFRKMTMDDVAKEAGVSKRTIYVYFATKEDLGLSFLRRLVEGIQADLAAIIASECTPVDKLTCVLTHRILKRVVGLKDYAQCLDEIFDGARTRCMEQRQEFFDIEHRMVARILEAGRQSGCFSFDDTHQVARSILVATNALLPYSLSVKEMGGLELIERDLRTMVSLLVGGLSVHPI